MGVYFGWGVGFNTLYLRALVVGGGEALVEAKERHGKVLSDCMHSMLG